MQVTYLGVSGFLIELKNKYLVFDYFEKGEYDGKVYEQHRIDPEKLKDKPVCVFCSHSHFDHYNLEVNKKWVKHKNVTFVLGEIGAKLPQTISMRAHQSMQVDDIKVVTARATDEGVCFLVFVDGLTIYHGGDHTDWRDMKDEYERQIDFLSEYTQKVDVAFAPVCNFFSRTNQGITDAAIHLTQKLGVKNFVPMHANNLAVYSLFKKENEQNIKSNVVVFDQIGKKLELLP